MNKLFVCRLQLVRAIIANKKGATAIFMTMVILSAILVVSLSTSDMVINGIKYNRVRYDSIKAFFAAETGAEQIMWELRRGGMNPLPVGGSGYCNNDPGEFCFSDVNDSTTMNGCETDCNNSSLDNYQNFANGERYELKFELDEHASDNDKSSTTLMSIGVFKDETRRIKLTYRSGE
ncbi:MAG: hypothetical protein U9Q85_00990 [Patescibacteria group bacterium]|nr:hypothetical protein [Patescibacteria group bacterium]